MNVDVRPQQRYRDERGGGPPGELKIKGQAGRQRGAGPGASRREQEGQRDGKGEGSNKAELERRENELKEKALRNKVIRTRKRSSS
ncbi:hypothetical protein FA13DRAFT_1789474 [Coprinellus micaceus]|uniref:Uncharacterized protein n=1 Tax=Coprinellus micaceus TaxID=71717 RepID=A0A4Y7TJJ3_COPMI|nr:hypothetical protein FA13DRAFT_1789474 [Coprinellus micaceus]